MYYKLTTVKLIPRLLGAVILAVSLALVGCQSSGGTGALAGGGIGALAGQAIGGNTEATLIGAAVGTGIGYIIGNEKDKKKAEEMSRASSANPPVHNETGLLGGTRWKLVSLVPENVAPPYISKTLEFRDDGRVITTTHKPDGKVETFNESYRVVADTLIINKPGYLVNAKYKMDGNELIVSAEKFSAVLERL